MSIESRVDSLRDLREPSGQRVPRAGLRIPPSESGPTGAFVVVEMVVLVVVAALAMVSIIVSSVEGVERGAAVQASHVQRGESLARSDGALRPGAVRGVASDFVVR